MGANAGRGYVNGNTSATSSGVTYLDTAVPCDETGNVKSIKCNLESNDTTLKIGCCSLSGVTAYPRVYVTIDITGLGVGIKTFTAPEDFTEFEMVVGDCIMFYSHTTGFCKIDRTSTPSPLGYAAIVGDHMDDASFIVDLYSDKAIEFEFSGTLPDWDSCESDGIDSVNIDEIDRQVLSNIDEIDEL